MDDFEILVRDPGPGYTYLRTTRAESAAKARKWFKDAYRGDFRSQDFKVRRA